MLVAVVKDLATRYTVDELKRATEAFEKNRENTLNVDGGDEGEKLSNLLAAIEVRTKMDQGVALNEALRHFSQRVRSVFAKPKNG